MVSSALSAFCPAGRVLEFACGTGIWSKQLLSFASRLTALDGSPEMLAINAARLDSPPERFAAFWQLVRSCLSPGGRVFFVDSRHEQTSTAVDHRLPEPEATVLRSRLNDGREFQIYKVFYNPADLTARLRELGWHFDIRQTDNYFLYGSGYPQNV